MSDTSLKALITTFVEAVDRDELGTAFAMVRDDAVCLIPPSLPLRNVQTKRDYLEVHSGIRRAFPLGLRWRLLNLTVERNRAVAEIESSGTHQSGGSYRSVHCLIFSVVDGSISEIHEHFDTLALFKLWLPTGALENLSWS